MFNDLMPNISRHFLYSLLTHNQLSGMTIIENVVESRPEDVGEFLSFLAMSLAGYFFRLETGLEDYDKMRIQELQDLKHLHLEEDLEELN